MCWSPGDSSWADSSAQERAGSGREAWVSSYLVRLSLAELPGYLCRTCCLLPPLLAGPSSTIDAVAVFALAKFCRWMEQSECSRILLPGIPVLLPLPVSQVSPTFACFLAPLYLLSPRIKQPCWCTTLISVGVAAGCSFLKVLQCLRFKDV